MSGEAEDAPDSVEKGMLPLQWTLDFNGRGAQGRYKVKVRRQKEGMDEMRRGKAKELGVFGRNRGGQIPIGLSRMPMECDMSSSSFKRKETRSWRNDGIS